ncbi:hypothetical protein B0J13DRAFT_541270 [Dactylonectria estremocensis]|uniref:Uncharacterized protein n=1 Tax=Dactylonectria estremocensis TaxID=1079267 RepID=A0A9P9JGC0_9HYPO|nr:hypothetical protein B0J13DRAFT_541270 [Dactylonectria estremocensis]
MQGKLQKLTATRRFIIYFIHLIAHTTTSIAFETQSAAATMRIPRNVDLCFVDLANWDWDTDAVRNAQDRGAVRRYFEALDRGFLGQAIRERYSFHGQIGSNGIVDGTGMHLNELIISYLQEYLDENDDRLEATKTVLTEGLLNTDDPGIELVRQMVSMMDADPPAARRKRALRVDVLGFLEEHDLDISKADRVLDVLLEE